MPDERVLVFLASLVLSVVIALFMASSFVWLDGIHRPREAVHYREEEPMASMTCPDCGATMRTDGACTNCGYTKKGGK